MTVNRQLIKTKKRNLNIILLIPIAFLLVNCRDNLKMEIIKRQESTTEGPSILTYTPGSKVVFSSNGSESSPSAESGTNESTPPLITANASLICSEISFYNMNGEIVQGTRDCSETLPECTQDGQTACKTTEIFIAADKSTILAGNIKRGVTIAGTTGNFPSTTSPLPRYSDSGATTNTTGSDETDLTNFITQLTSSGSFEYWDSNGVRRTGSGDADLTDANIKSGVVFENLSITGNAPGAPCSYGAQGTCETDTACRWIGAVCELNPWHIRKGITISGQTGNITFFRNMIGSYDRTSGTGALAGADIYDTVDDLNNNGSFPTTAPGGWDQATGSNWTEVVANTTYKDEITGLVWTADQGSFTWEDAITQCDGLSNFGGRSDWRLPTQKELQQAYVNGIWTKNTELSLNGNPWYWSSSSRSVDTTDAWTIRLNLGYTMDIDKGSSPSWRVICVAE